MVSPNQRERNSDETEDSERVRLSSVDVAEVVESVMIIQQSQNGSRENRTT